MKKVFAIALIATAMVACNNSGDKKTDADTTKVDTAAPVTPDTAAPVAPDTTAAPVKDSVTK
ncbi:MAG: hypothetical protein ACT4OJ_04980 [Bacteroidota bacterium]